MKAYFNLSFTQIMVILLVNFSFLQTIRAQEYLKNYEVYDFEQGDEFHYKDEYKRIIHSTNETIYLKDNLTNYTILEKYYSSAEDTLFYIRNVKMKDFLNGQLVEKTDTIFYANLSENAAPIGWVVIKIDSNYCNGREINDYSEGDSFYVKTKWYVRGCGNTRVSGSNSGGGETSSYSYKLIYYRKGEETWGGPVYVSVEKHEAQKDVVILHPNPARDRVYIDVSGRGEFDCYIYNQTGQLIEQVRLDDKRNWLDVSNLKPGIYYVKVSHDNYSSATKLIRM